MIKRIFSVYVALTLAACGSAPHPCPAQAGEVVYVVGAGWHAEIGIPVQELDGDLRFYRKVFPDARAIMFGYGKKTFFTAPPRTLSEYFLGPVPGPAVIHAVGLRVTPLQAYGAEDTVMLTLPPGGAKKLSVYIWRDLAKNDAGKPCIVARSSHPAGVFYAARSEYNLLHTCNAWTGDALHAAGLPVSGNGMLFSGQVMAQAGKTAGSQCRVVIPP